MLPLLFTLTTAAALAQTGPGNGGDPRSLSFIDVGYELNESLEHQPTLLPDLNRDRFYRLLGQVDLVWEDSLTAPVCAAGPSAWPEHLGGTLSNGTCTLPEITQIRVWGNVWNQAEHNRCIARVLVAHSLLPLLGREDAEFHASTQWVSQAFAHERCTFNVDPRTALRWPLDCGEGGGATTYGAGQRCVINQRHSRIRCYSETQGISSVSGLRCALLVTGEGGICCD